MENHNLRTRQKSILAGLYLSKFDEEGLTALGFKGFKEAFNVIGYSLGVKPASIKNYRDEFDPYFPNSRKGWHKRPIREHCKDVMNEFIHISFEDFTELINSFLIDNYEVERILKNITKKDKSETVAKRLITGKAAEEYFKLNYPNIETFKGFHLQDTTHLACGFDFRLTNNPDYFCVEVKGLSEKSGSISLTEKEFWVANELKKLYCLFIVSNFNETPIHQLFFDPINSRLTFKKIERQVVQTSYSTIL